MNDDDNIHSVSATQFGVPIFSLCDRPALGFPPSSIPSLLPSSAHVLSGGGGAAKTGVRNQICIFEISPLPLGLGVQAKTILIHSTREKLAVSIDVSRDGRFLACSIDDKCMLLGCVMEENHDSNNEKKETLQLIELCSIKTDSPISNLISNLKIEPAQNVVRFSPMCTSLATGGEDGIVKIYDIMHDNDESEPQKGICLELFCKLIGHSKPVKDLVFHPFGRLLASISPGDNSCRLWSIPEKRIVQILPSDIKGNLTYRTVRFASPDRLLTLQVPINRRGASYIVSWKNPLIEQSILNSQNSSSTLSNKKNDESDVSRRWKLENIKKVMNGLATTFSVSGCGKYVAVGGADGEIALFDARSLVEIKRVPGVHGLPATGISFAAVPEQNPTVVSKTPITTHMVSVSADRSCAMIAITPSRPSRRTRIFNTIKTILISLIIFMLSTLGLWMVLFDGNKNFYFENQSETMTIPAKISQISISDQDTANEL